MTIQGFRIGCLCAAIALLLACVPKETEHVQRLEPREGSLERTIAESETHLYLVSLSIGEFLDLRVEQKNADVTIAVDSGAEVVEYDSPNRLHGPEEVPFVARETGLHRIAVRAIGGQGSYRLLFSVSQEPGEAERRRDNRARSLARARQWREKGGEDNHRRAAGIFASTILTTRRSGEDYAAAMAWRELAQTRLYQTRPAAALAAFREARELVKKLDDFRQEINLLNLESALLLHMGEPKGALSTAQQALGLAQEHRDDFGIAVALNNSALGRRQSGQTEAALRDEIEAVGVWEELELPAHLALTLRNLGNGYLALGREEEALESLERSRQLYRSEGDEVGAAAASAFIGQALARRGETKSALAELESAYVLQERLGDYRAAAATLSRLAEVKAENDDFPAAEEAWRVAIELQTQTREPLRRAWTVTEREWWRLAAEPWQRRGGGAGPNADLDAALELFEERHDLAGQSFALLVRARSLAASGTSRHHLLHAAEDAQAALEVFERIRGEVSVPAYRRSILSSRHAFYETLIAILMELDEAEPGNGYAERAFAISERSRSRVLLDHFGGPPLGLVELQRHLFGRTSDHSSLLLEFHLGSKRSFLFLVGHDRFRVVALPRLQVFEESARRLHDLLARRDRALAETQARLAAAELGDLLFGQIQSELADSKRLMIAADGALHYIPFGALVVDGRFLLQDHEVVHVPSASFLVHQQRHIGSRSPALLTLAMIADPVYETNSAESTSGGAIWSRDLARAADDIGLEVFAQLPGARREAEAALALVPATKSLKAMGPDATREFVLSGALANYRILHFATHGLLNVRRPELSGLVLSSRDALGKSQDGFLRARDIEGLELSADLVVLSACRTGLGKEERGAGLVGLPQSFLTAGARGVIVSLWKVGDASTATLMEQFYLSLLKEGRRPSQALREAQLFMISGGDHSLHSWAPFVLMGDWR